jgi:DNA-binding PadR family transcriptional regulator
MNLMSEEKQIQKYLPLTEATYYIMLALEKPLHGYGVMQKVKQASEGRVEVGPGTLYGAFSTLQEEDLIQMIKKEDRRKVYALTPKGTEVLRGQIQRLQIMTKLGSDFLSRLG